MNTITCGVMNSEGVAIEKGDTFASFEEANSKIEKEAERCFCQYYRRDSRSIEGAKKKTKRFLNSNLKYYEIKYCCIHGGRQFKSRGHGVRNKKTFRKEIACPSHILLRADQSGNNLEVISIQKKHNHIIDRNLFHHLPHQRRLNNELKEEATRLLKVKCNTSIIQQHLREQSKQAITLNDLRNLELLEKKDKKIDLQNICSKINTKYGATCDALEMFLPTSTHTVFLSEVALLIISLLKCPFTCTTALFPARICSTHFNKSDFKPTPEYMKNVENYAPKNIRTLQPHAVPTKNLTHNSRNIFQDDKPSVSDETRTTEESPHVEIIYVSETDFENVSCQLRLEEMQNEIQMLRQELRRMIHKCNRLTKQNTIITRNVKRLQSKSYINKKIRDVLKNYFT